TRSPDGRLYKGRTGIARMALVAKVPVIPVVMVDTDTMLPIGSSRPRLVRVGMVLGEPLDFSRYEGFEDDRFVLRSVTDEIMVALQRLGGQEYVDDYASKFRQQAGASGDTKGSAFSCLPFPAVRSVGCSTTWTRSTHGANSRSSSSPHGLTRPRSSWCPPSWPPFRRSCLPVRSTRCAIASARQLRAGRSCFRAETAPRPSRVRRPTRSATASRPFCRWPSS